MELLDNDRLINQLLNLERRSGRAGKDSIDHGPHGHDDVVNAAAGAVVLAAHNRPYTATWGRNDAPTRQLPVFLQEAVAGSIRVHDHKVILP